MPPSPQFSADTPSLSLKTSQDGGVLLDLEHDRLLKLNPVGVEIWNLLRAGDAESQIVWKIAHKYSVDEQRVAKDVSALLHKIAELQVPMSSSVSTEQLQPTAPGKKTPSYPWYGQDPTASRPKPKATTVLFALIGLLTFDLILSVFSLQSLCSCVKKWP